MDSCAFRIYQLRSILKVYTNLCDVKSPCPPFADDPDLQFAKDNMLIVLLSWLYSLFDPSGLSLGTMKAPVPDALKGDLQPIIDKWHCIEAPITRIRHNLGFHGGPVKTTANATNAFCDLGERGIEQAFHLISDLCHLADKYAAQEGANK